MKTIVLPQEVDKENIREVVIAFRKYVSSPDNDKQLKIDMTKISFIKPSGIIALNNIIQWVKKHEGISGGFIVSLHDEHVSGNRKAMEYLEDCGFFSSLGYKNTFKLPCTRKTMLRVKDVDTDKVEQWKLTDLKIWLQQQTGRKNEFSAICVAIDEIFNNISDHSQEKIGCIFGQYYPTKQEIIIAVSDFGIGIPQSIRTKYGADKKDNELIEYALEEGNSTQSVPQNRGAGLPNIMRTVTSNGIGEFTIISNCGIVRVVDNKIENSLVLDESYPGTFFEIKIDTSNENLYDQDEEEEFEW